MTSNPRHTLSDEARVAAANIYAPDNTEQRVGFIIGSAWVLDQLRDVMNNAGNTQVEKIAALMEALHLIPSTAAPTVGPATSAALSRGGLITGSTPPVHITPVAGGLTAADIAIIQDKIRNYEERLKAKAKEVEVAVRQNLPKEEPPRKGFWKRIFS